MSNLFPSLSSLGGAFPAPSTGFVPCFNVAGVLDDAKDKAKSLETHAKDNLAGAKGALKSEAEVLRTKANAASPSKPGIELYSPKYYGACVLGGILACGITHALVTPLDLVKCRRQVDKNLYAGNMDGWRRIYGAGGLKGLYTGVGPTLLGYSIQGACKYGFYELFKKKYSDLAGPVNAVKYKDAIYLAGSASAEFIADAAFVPFEAVKVRMQVTMPSYASGTTAAFAKFTSTDGAAGLYKSLPSLWSRQIPYTMMKFWSFEATVSKIYTSLGKPKESYNKLQQLGVSFLGGYIAGIFCAVVSHPADTMVSKLNASAKEGAAKPTVGSIYKEIGFGGLWAGLGTRVVMIGTLTALQWLIYDTLKVSFGLPSTGGAVEQKK